jgi:cytochrome P450
MITRIFDLLRRDGSARRHPGLPPSLPLSPLEQAWYYAVDPVKFMERGRLEVGATFTLDVPRFGPVVVFTEEASVRKLIEGTSAEFGNAADVGKFFLGPNSILFLEGEAHAAARGRTMAAISGERMRSYGGVIIEAADRLVEGLRPGQPMEAIEVARELALAVIFRALLGLSDGPVYERLKHQTKHFLDGGHSKLANLMSLYLPGDSLRPIVFGRRDPGTMRSLPEQGVHGLVGRLPPIRAARDLLDGLVEHIEWRTAHLDVKGDDALGFILQRARASGRPYSGAEALDETLTILLAGHDTTAIILAWALYHVGRNEAVRTRLKAEIDAACPEKTFNPRNIERLPYLRAVIDETFRLDGIARGLARRLRRDTVIEGYPLPAGTVVIGYPHGFTRDVKNFPTPEEFEPAQMLGKKLRPHEFTPFGGGYRRCVGAAFAEYELALLIGRIVQRVSFRTPPGLSVGEGLLGPLRAPDRPIPLEVLEVRPA